MSDPEDIRNFLRLSDRVTTSGKLDPGDPARLAAMGVRHVINLAMADHPEALPDAEAEMADAGLRYTHIPVPFDAPPRTHYRRLRCLGEGGAPVHVHCIMNWRVSAFFYRLNRERGMDEAEARALDAAHLDPQGSDHPHAASGPRSS